MSHGIREYGNNDSFAKIKTKRNLDYERLYKNIFKNLSGQHIKNSAVNMPASTIPSPYIFEIETALQRTSSTYPLNIKFNFLIKRGDSRHANFGT